MNLRFSIDLYMKTFIFTYTQITKFHSKWLLFIKELSFTCIEVLLNLRGRNEMLQTFENSLIPVFVFDKQICFQFIAILFFY